MPAIGLVSLPLADTGVMVGRVCVRAFLTLNLVTPSCAFAPPASSGLYALDTASMEISPVGDCGMNVSRIARSANLTVAVSWDGTNKQTRR